MKKVYKIIINIIVFVFILSRLAMAETKNNIAITINDEHVEFNDNLGYPFIDSNNRSLVPFRVTLEKFGAKVSWDNTNKIAIAEKYGYKVEVPIGKSYISKDGERIEIDTSAQIIDGRTYLPIRAVFEAFGAKVFWDNDNGTVVVTYNIQDNESIISSELMKEDLDFLVKTVGEVHPSTFYGYSLNQKDIIKSLYDKIKEPLAKDEFYFNINRLVTSLNDGHTSLSYNGNKWINLPMVWTTDGIIIYEDYQDFKKGDKIISFGGLTEGVLFEELSKVLSSDNKYWIKAYGTHALSQEIYLRYFNLIHDSKVKIFIERNRQKFNISVPLENNFLNLSHKENPNWIRWELDEENSLGILYLDKCFINDEFNETLAAFMREVKNNKIKNIAVDLRNNPGGSSEVAYAFLMYTNKSNYKSFRGGIRYSPRINELINQPIERTGLNYVIAGVAMNVDFAKKINQDDSLREQFSGDIYILTSNNTFSAAVWFTILFKDNDEATIIGEPTGGKPSHFGEALDFKLPNSNFTLNISCKDFIRPDKEKVDADAMYPHYIVNTTRNDILNNLDPQINKVKELIAIKDMKGVSIPSESEVEIFFKDLNFENVVRENIGKPTGPIYKSDVELIKTLYANDKNIISLEGIQNLNNLEDLRLARNQIADITPIKELKILKFLYIPDNQVSNIDIIGELKELRSLSIQNNLIKDIGPLRNLIHLTSLELNSNNIYDLDALENLINLNYLNVYNNRNLTNIDGIRNLKNLNYFLAFSCNITDISSLSNLTNLGRLELQGNKISDVSPLSNLTNLYTLRLSYNNISDYLPLLNLKYLNALDIHNNPINNFEQLKSNFKYLKSYNSNPHIIY